MRALALSMLLLGVAAGQEYDLTPAPGNRPELIVDKTGLVRGKSHLFTFERFHGSVFLHAANLTQSSASLSIEAASVLCRDQWLREKDLKKVQAYAEKNMLEVARYSIIHFTSNTTVQTAPDRFDVNGALTIRDVTKPVTVHVRVEPGANVFAGSATVRLTDYNLKPPSAALGAIGTKDEMQFRFHLAARPHSQTD